jgi:TRAP transporter T-component
LTARSPGSYDSATMRARLSVLLLACVSALTQAGCIKSYLIDGQIASTREAAGVTNSIADYELARAAASGGLVQFEGLHKLAPDNTDALYLLTSTWAQYAFAFPNDDYDAARFAGDDNLADYHKKRAKIGYDRCVAYGLELMSKRADGFQAAKKNADTMKKWLTEHFTSEDDAVSVLWTGLGWMARVNLLKDEPEYVAELFVGVAMLERSREIDPTIENWNAVATLGSYHGRSSMAELDESKKLFELALEKTQRKSLGIQVGYATSYACAKPDQALYEKLLNEVLTADDPDPNQRLSNTVAKRRAKRFLGKAAMEECGFTPGAAPPAATPPQAPPPK